MSIYRTLRSSGLAIILTASLAVTFAQAQEFSVEHLKEARQALRASQASDTFDRILPGVSGRIKSTLISSRPDLSDQISAIVDIKTLELAPRRGDLEKEATLIFAKVFTLDELKTISIFYFSDAGKKFLKEAPILTREMGQAARIWEAGLFRDLTDIVTKEMETQGLNK